MNNQQPEFLSSVVKPESNKTITIKELKEWRSFLALES
jgi:hypothetical protein